MTSITTALSFARAAVPGLHAPNRCRPLVSTVLRRRVRVQGMREDESGAKPLSGEVVIYASTVALTFGTLSVWYLFRDAIEDLVYGGDLFSLFGTSVSLGDLSAVMLWTVGYYFASPVQLLLVFLGRFEKERPSDWILCRLGKIFDQPVDSASYSPGAGLYVLMFGSVLSLALATTVGLKLAFGDATWGVSTGIGACMAAGVFEISRPQRLSAAEKAVMQEQFAEFAEFAEARLRRTGSCHESEVFRAFRTEVQGYRDEEKVPDWTLREFVRRWAPQTDRTGNGFLKKLSVKPRVDPFR